MYIKVITTHKESRKQKLVFALRVMYSSIVFNQNKGAWNWGMVLLYLHGILCVEVGIFLVA